MEQKVIYHYINLNQLDIQKTYECLVRNMMEIATILDDTRGTNYAKDVERGELTVPDLLTLLHFGEMTYMKYNEANNKYVMIPFCVLYSRPSEDTDLESDDVNVSDTFVFYSGNPNEESAEVKGFKTWLNGTEYNGIYNNIEKKTDEEAVELIQNHNTVLLYKDDIYTM